MGFPFLETILTQLPNSIHFFGFFWVGLYRAFWVDPTHEHPYGLYKGNIKQCPGALVKEL